MSAIRRIHPTRHLQSGAVAVQVRMVFPQVNGLSDRLVERRMRHDHRIVHVRPAATHAVGSQGKLPGSRQDERTRRRAEHDPRQRTDRVVDGRQPGQSAECRVVGCRRHVAAVPVCRIAPVVARRAAAGPLDAAGVGFLVEDRHAVNRPHGPPLRLANERDVVREAFVERRASHKRANPRLVAGWDRDLHLPVAGTKRRASRESGSGREREVRVAGHGKRGCDNGARHDERGVVGEREVRAGEGPADVSRVPDHRRCVAGQRRVAGYDHVASDVESRLLIHRERLHNLSGIPFVSNIARRRQDCAVREDDVAYRVEPAGVRTRDCHAVLPDKAEIRLRVRAGEGASAIALDRQVPVAAVALQRSGGDLAGGLAVLVVCRVEHGLAVNDSRNARERHVLPPHANRRTVAEPQHRFRTGGILPYVHVGPVQPQRDIGGVVQIKTVQDERPSAGDGLDGVGVGEHETMVDRVRGAERAAVHDPFVVHARLQRKGKEYLPGPDDRIAGHGQVRAGIGNQIVFETRLCIVGYRERSAGVEPEVLGRHVGIALKRHRGGASAGVANVQLIIRPDVKILAKRQVAENCLRVVGCIRHVHIQYQATGRRVGIEKAPRPVCRNDPRSRDRRACRPAAIQRKAVHLDRVVERHRKGRRIRT